MKAATKTDSWMQQRGKREVERGVFRIWILYVYFTAFRNGPLRMMEVPKPRR